MEDTAIPEQYRTSPVGRDLAERVTASHRSDQLHQSAERRTEQQQPPERTGPDVQKQPAGWERIDAWRDEQPRREEQQRDPASWGSTHDAAPGRDREGPGR